MNLTIKDVKEQFVKLIVIGRYYNSTKKFRQVYGTTLSSSIIQAFSINLWNGRVYGVAADGKRTCLKHVIN